MSSSHVIFNIWNRIRFKCIAKSDCFLITWEVCKNIHSWTSGESVWSEIPGNYDAQLHLTASNFVYDHIYKEKLHVLCRDTLNKDQVIDQKQGPERGSQFLLDKRYEDL